MNPILKVHQIHKSYQQGDHQVEVLQNLSIEADRGEKVAILGPSGCGKSTLLSLLTGLDKPDRGSVEIDGRDLVRMSEDERSIIRSQKCRRSRPCGIAAAMRSRKPPTKAASWP